MPPAHTHSRLTWWAVLSVSVLLGVLSTCFSFMGDGVGVEDVIVAAEQPAQAPSTRTEAVIPAQYSLNRTPGILMGETFDVMIARTEAEQALGLGGLPLLRSREAMIFPYGLSEGRGFWMKGMLFSIDIAWLDENFRIVSIQDSASPDSYPKIFFPRAPARFVVEFPAGTMKSFGAKVGDVFEIDRSALENR